MATIPFVEPITELSSAAGVDVICARNADVLNPWAEAGGRLNAVTINVPAIMRSMEMPNIRDDFIVFCWL